MCKIKCKTGEENLMQISNVNSNGYMTTHINKYGDLIEYNKEVYTETTSKILFCKNCREFYGYYELLYMGAMDDCIEIDTISIDKVFDELSDKFLHIPECINFKVLKEVFSILKIDFKRATRAIAYNVVYKEKPAIHVFEPN